MLSNFVFGRRDTSGVLKLITILIIIGGVIISAFSRLGKSEGGHSSPNSQESETSKTYCDEAVSFEENDEKPKPEIAYFAGMVKNNGPYPRYSVSYFTKGQKGATVRTDLGHFYDYRVAVEKADALNAEIGVTKRMARRIMQDCRK
jgi:hypothetical protein